MKHETFITFWSSTNILVIWSPWWIISARRSLNGCTGSTSPKFNLLTVHFQLYDCVWGGWSGAAACCLVFYRLSGWASTSPTGGAPCFPTIIASAGLIQVKIIISSSITTTNYTVVVFSNKAWSRAFLIPTHGIDVFAPFEPWIHRSIITACYAYTGVPLISTFPFLTAPVEECLNRLHIQILLKIWWRKIKG